MHTWFRWGLTNLVLVALYGLLMRYKIAFYLPFLEQKNLLHAHSHFAFCGWISQLLYTGLIRFLHPYIPLVKQRIYKVLLTLNLIAAFGMLIAFTLQGYKVVSIAFSSFSILIAVVFTVSFIKDVRFLNTPHPAVPWAITGLLLNVLSSAGPLSLGYMMATKQIDQNFYLGSVYYYLHFQYNGWFFFGSIALLAIIAPSTGKLLRKYFAAFAIMVVPTFLLSVLWANLPQWLYVIAVVATIIQLGAWIGLITAGYKIVKGRLRPSPEKTLFYAAALALTLKFLLQSISVIPSLSQLVFGFRPIVIAYLHLVLLGVYTLFLFGYLFHQKIIPPSKGCIVSAFIFLTGVIMNEVFLGVQGLAAFSYFPVPFINELLLAAAVVLFCGATGLAIAQFGKVKQPLYSL